MSEEIRDPYTLLADALRAVRPSNRTFQRTQWEMDVRVVAATLATLAPLDINFSIPRWLALAGDDLGAELVGGLAALPSNKPPTGPGT